MEHRNAFRPRRSVVAAVTVGVAGSLALGVPASASPQTTNPHTNASAPEAHTLGSQIRLHEGGQNTSLPPAVDSVAGIDVSSHQGNVDWGSYAAQGNKFAYSKATEGTNYTSPAFAQQYNGSASAGMIRGAYHFAHPDSSSGAEQAKYFVQNGGGWSQDGRTLPGALDIEYNPNGDNCYGLDSTQMGSWVSDFSNTYHQLTGRYPVIYTSTNWWKQCASGNFGATNPLWVANYNGSVGELPAGWGQHTIWQHSSEPVDQNKFNGGEPQLKQLATG